MAARRGVARMGPRVGTPHRGMRQEASRTAAREEVAGIAGYRALIRSLDQQGAARRRQAPDQDRIARKTRLESQLSRQIRNGSEATTYSLDCPVSKDRSSHTSGSLTGDFRGSAKLRRSLGRQ
jgi:hypothetical protein